MRFLPKWMLKNYIYRHFVLYVNKYLSLFVLIKIKI
jgi:hypothetical protein